MAATSCPARHLGYRIMHGGGEAIQVDTLEVPESWKNEEIILQAINESQFKLIYQDEVFLEGEVGKLAVKQPEGYLQPVKILSLICNLARIPCSL